MGKDMHYTYTNILYFIESCEHTSIVRTFILQFDLNTLFMNEVGDCYVPSMVGRKYFSSNMNEKKCALYLIQYSKYWQAKHSSLFLSYLKKVFNINVCMME